MLSGVCKSRLTVLLYFAEAMTGSGFLARGKIDNVVDTVNFFGPRTCQTGLPGGWTGT